MFNHGSYNDAEALKWISERNREALAFMVNIPKEIYDDDTHETSALEDYDFVN